MQAGRQAVASGAKQQLEPTALRKTAPRSGREQGVAAQLLLLWHSALSPTVLRHTATPAPPWCVLGGWY